MTRLIIDGMSVFKTVTGQAAHLDRGYAYSFLVQVTAALKKLRPKGVAVCWEGGYAKRSALLPGYKSNRTPSNEATRAQRTELQRLLQHLGADQYWAPDHEADDMIACLANTWQQPCVIMSADKDMLQLVNSRVSVYQRVRLNTGKKTERQLITKSNFQEKTGWHTPAQFLQAHCALGDAVDQIPKLAGVGEPVIHAYFMGMEIAPSKKALLDQFYADSPQYKLNRQLIDLTNVRELAYKVTPGSWNEGAAYGLLRELGFASMADKFDTWVKTWQEACGSADFSTLPRL